MMRSSLLHGDLVLEPSVMSDLPHRRKSCVAVDASAPLPEKDFKARITDNRVKAIGIEYFGADCVACQPIYHMQKKDMLLWLEQIKRFCANGSEMSMPKKHLTIYWTKWICLLKSLAAGFVMRLIMQKT